MSALGTRMQRYNRPDLCSNESPSIVTMATRYLLQFRQKVIFSLRSGRDFRIARATRVACFGGLPLGQDATGAPPDGFPQCGKGLRRSP